MKKLLSLAFLFIILFAQNNLAQDNKPPLTKEESTRLGLLVGISSQPVIYGEKGDNLSKKIKLRGIMKK